jgi:prepilin-type N-terminal cleavage/methylation domain-containing protein
MKRRQDNLRGFTLVELMAYMALFGMILSLIYSIYYQFSRTISAAEITMLKERQTFSLIQKMQDDFRQSKSVLDSFGSFKRSGKCLILSLPGEGNSSNEVVVYKYDKGDITRYHYESSQRELVPSSVIVGKGIKKFKYSFKQEKENLLGVSLVLNEGPFGAFSGRTLQFSVARRNG